MNINAISPIFLIDSGSVKKKDGSEENGFSVNNKFSRLKTVILLKSKVTEHSMHN